MMERKEEGKTPKSLSRCFRDHSLFYVKLIDTKEVQAPKRRTNWTRKETTGLVENRSAPLIREREKVGEAGRAKEGEVTRERPREERGFGTRRLLF